MEPTTVPETGKLTQSTRRSFIRGIAAAGASTAAAAALERAGLDLFGSAVADADPGAMPFSDFTAIAPSPADAFQVPEGYRADLLMRFGDEFANDAGDTFSWGCNNDFLAFFPLPGKTGEVLLFANHEYPSPFFQHGYKEQDLNPGDPNTKHTKSAADVQAEQDAVGNSILHVKRHEDGVWRTVSPSPYNRRIHGDRPQLEFTGPRAGDDGIGEFANGSVGNCSGGITPWGTALSCEENFDGYGLALGNSDFMYGWVENGGQPEDAESHPGPPYRAAGTPLRQVRLGVRARPLRPLRHRAQAHRARALPPREHRVRPGARQAVRPLHGRRQGQRGDLPLRLGPLLPAGPAGQQPAHPRGGHAVHRALRARRAPPLHDERRHRADHRHRGHGRVGGGARVGARRHRDQAARALHGRGLQRALRDEPARGRRGRCRRDHLRRVDEQLERQRRARLGAADRRGRQRPDGRDLHVGGLRGRRPDRALGRRRGRLLLARQPRVRLRAQRLGRDGHLVELAQPARPVRVPREQRGVHDPDDGRERGRRVRFANGPVESETTGPYFTPDESTLFLNIQHPGEGTQTSAASVFGDLQTSTSWWPEGNKTADQDPSTPLPSLVAVTRIKEGAEEPGSPTIPPPAGVGGDGIPGPCPAPGPGPDGTRPRVELLSPGRQSLSRLRTRGLSFRLRVSEPTRVTVTLTGRLQTRRGRRGKVRRLARATIRISRAGEATVRLRPSSAIRLLRREEVLPAILQVKAVDDAGNRTTRTKQLKFR